MRTKYFFLSFLSIFIFCVSFPLSFLFSVNFQNKASTSDDCIHALSSLIFYVHEHDKSLDEHSQADDKIEFSAQDIANLWNKVGQEISSQSNSNQQWPLFQEAYKSYEEAEFAVQKNEQEVAHQSLKSTSNALNTLWQNALEEEDKATNFEYISSIRARKIEDPNMENNPYVSAEAKKAMQPYLLSLKHPMRSVLDSIFLKKRVTVDKRTFYKAGFRIIAEGPRSYILVAKHRKLPGFLVKAHVDTELHKKHQKESWQWLVRRCQGASKIREIIKKRNIRYFVVPDKWLYCLPAQPSPPNDGHHTRHLALLLTNDMELVTEKRNYYAWSHYITKQHLDELYTIISRAKGSSYRPDNIAYTKHDQFAFIDTEYPTSGPDYKRIRPYLNSEMRHYWDKLVKTGGP